MKLIRYALISFFMASLLTGCATTGTAPDRNVLPIAKNTYPMPRPGNDLIGQDQVIRAQSGQTLTSIAQEYDIGLEELQAANPKADYYKLFPDQKIVIPSRYILPPKQYRSGIVVNTAEMRLYYFSGNTIMTFPVAVGRDGWGTPLVNNYVYRKQKDPYWYPPKSVREYMEKKHGRTFPSRVAPGPDNPLGDYAIYMQLDGYVIHGTNDPKSIGHRVSSGCIRMYNSDVKALFEQVKFGTPIHIIYYPNKVGWQDNKLYLEAHKPIRNDNPAYKEAVIPARQLILQATENHPAVIDWEKVSQVLKAKSGIATVIGYTKPEESNTNSEANRAA